MSTPIYDGAGDIVGYIGGSALSLTWGSGVVQGAPVYASGTNACLRAVATAMSTGRVVGLADTTNLVVVDGVAAKGVFVPGLTLAAGDVAFLSKTLGKLTNDVSAFGRGDVVQQVGIVVNPFTYNSGTGAGYGMVFIQVKDPIQL